MGPTDTNRPDGGSSVGKLKGDALGEIQRGRRRRRRGGNVGLNAGCGKQRGLSLCDLSEPLAPPRVQCRHNRLARPIVVVEGKSILRRCGHIDEFPAEPGPLDQRVAEDPGRSGPGLPFSLRDLLQNGHVECLIGHQPLQAGVLLFEFLESIQGVLLDAGILPFPSLVGCHAHPAMSRQASPTVLPPAKASSVLRSFLMISSGVCRFLFMGVGGAHAPGLS